MNFCLLAAPSTEPGHFALDPAFHTAVDLVRLEPFGIDGLADAHHDGAGMLPEGVAPPELACVMRHGHHQRTGVFGKHCTADLVLAVHAIGHAGAFGEDYHAEAA